MGIKNLFINLGLSLLTMLFLLLVLEFGLRGYQRASQWIVGTNPQNNQPIARHIPIDKPFFYGLNPKHPQHSSQGIRDDEVEIPKPKDRLRILVLGDSIAYGARVKKHLTFPNQLETLLGDHYASVEVINSGVAGYTAFNELQYYLSEGRKFEADIVMLAFCMNDVANPRLHWGYVKETIQDIPNEAIPNPIYDKDHIIPLMAARKKTKEMEREKKKDQFSVLNHSRLYSEIELRIKALIKNNKQKEITKISAIPTYITGEDTLSIEVLLDQKSQEWRWLTNIYDQLHDAIRADQAQFMIAFFPLAYQLDDDYPYFPQNNLMDYCAQNSIACIDLLPAYKQSPVKNDIFIRYKNKRVDDIWHLEATGHELTAKAIFQYLQRHGLLKLKNGEAAQVLEREIETSNE